LFSNEEILRSTNIGTDMIVIVEKIAVDFDRDKCKIMYTDTDGLIYYVEHNDVYETTK